ncbi:hypothetical protein TrRE_jg8806 [Triparma retinervis]|uniref:Histone-binding protein RBBP4 N-terminal domain-containing protein n=1 Tax=Triparma retinervis TaxID=2557542 RepID=A0A9W7L8J8_9STRA|nr:hypothetical protein TrRE_jg8806 [Triparma retinervis]
MANDAVAVASAPDAEDVLQEKIISDEYKVWKKNSPFLYDLVLTSALEWPSLTTQWLPTVRDSGKEYNEHSLLLGTHTTDEQNYLMVANVTLPKEDTEIDARAYNDEKEEVGGFGAVGNKVEIRMKIKHEGEVHRARYCPQNPFVVATRGPKAEAFVFDMSKHSSFPAEGSAFNPQHRLQGHEAEGYGLCWSAHDEGKLATAGEDKLLCLWDVKKASAVVSPVATFKHHTDAIEDCAWHAQDANLVGTTGDDKMVCVWDIRDPSKPAHVRENAHGKDINSLAFNPSQSFLFATASSDQTVGLWDLRNLKDPVSIFRGHTDEVYQVSWQSGEDGTILASCGADRRVNVWDLSRIGMEQDPEEAEDGPPELLFIHGGHTAKLNDVSFNLNDPWVVASVSEDNVLQVWNMAENIYADYDDEEEGKGDDELNDEDLEN